jgi:hypothetical protein
MTAMTMRATSEIMMAYSTRPCPCSFDANNMTSFLSKRLVWVGVLLLQYHGRTEIFGISYSDYENATKRLPYGILNLLG